MASEITLTELASTAPDIVRAQVLQARYAKSKVVPHVLNVDAEVQKKGDRVSLSVIPALTVQTVSSGGGVGTKANNSSTSVEVVVNQWKYIRTDFELQALRQTGIPAVRAYLDSVGGALGEDEDATLLAEQSNMTGYTDPGGANPLSDAIVRKARLLLDRANIPEDDRVFILHPDAEADLLALARFSEAQTTGLARGLQIDKGRLSGLYGIPVVVTSLVKETSSQKRNILIHRECLAIATQKNFTVHRLAMIQLSEDYVAEILYGVKTIRTSHGVVLSSSPNA